MYGTYEAVRPEILGDVVEHDILYWIANDPWFGKQAVYLDSRVENEAGYQLAIGGME
jgi:hypothetical protein